MLREAKEKLKQAVCKHDYEKVSDKMVAKNRHYIILQSKLVCKKCGKVVYR